VPEDVVSRAVRVADRWWGIDGASVRACQMAAVLMAELGRDDLKWAYLTTPVAVSHGDSRQWREVAVFARHEGDPAMAELALREAAATQKKRNR